MYPIIHLIAAIYLLIVAMMMETKNIQSLLLFKALPVLLGLFTGLDALNRLGWMPG